MKQLMLIAVFAISTAVASAQISFGLQVGANLAFASVKSDNGTGGTKKEDTKPNIGVLGGFVADIPFTSAISFRPELNFVQKGFKQKNSNSFYSNDYKTTLNYIDIPLNFAYNLNAGNSKVFFGLGPVISVGLSGKIKGTQTVTGFPSDKIDVNVKFDGKKDKDLSPTDVDAHLKRLDIGANVFAGFKMPMGVFAKIGYTYGFLDIDPNVGKFNNSGLSLSIGYMIGGSRSKKS